MSQSWIAILVTAGIVLAVDLLATQLRKRARRITVFSELSPDKEEPHGSTDGEVTVSTE
jgi:hypothetical protein